MVHLFNGSCDVITQYCLAFQLNLQQEVSFVSAALQEERFRVERLEEQINDLTELHQNEVETFIVFQNIFTVQFKLFIS